LYKAKPNTENIKGLAKVHIELCGAVEAGQGKTAQKKKTVWHSCRRISDSSFVRQFDEGRGSFVRVTKSKIKKHVD
jgi:hypothetical protein